MALSDRAPLPMLAALASASANKNGGIPTQQYAQRSLSEVSRDKVPAATAVIVHALRLHPGSM